MEVSLGEIKHQTGFDNARTGSEQQQEENKNCTKTTSVAKTEFATDDNDDTALFASLPKAEIKIRKLEDSKLLMDNNENSLSVDTLIEMLSSNDPSIKLPTTTCGIPPQSAASSLSSPSSASYTSSSSKPGLSETITSPGPSPPESAGITSIKKFPSPYHLNGGKPMISDMNKKMKQVAKRAPRAVYQSKISDNSSGIKLCIKKSVKKSLKSMPSPNNKTPRKRSRKSRAKGHGSDSDDAYVKRRKKSSAVNNNNNHTKTPSDEPVEQSGWGKEMPKEILFDVSDAGGRRPRLCVDFSISLFLDFQVGGERRGCDTGSMQISARLLGVA